MRREYFKFYVGFLVSSLLVACGGGGGSSSSPYAYSPFVLLNSNKIQPKQDETVTFTPTVTDGSGTYVSFKWTFSDGRASITNATNTPLSVSFRTLGQQTVTLEVTDANGKSSQGSSLVVVQPFVSNSGIVSAAFDSSSAAMMIYAASAATNGVDSLVVDPTNNPVFTFGSGNELLKIQPNGSTTNDLLQLTNDTTYGITAVSDLEGDTGYQAGKWVFGQETHTRSGVAVTASAANANLSYVLFKPVGSSTTLRNFTCNTTSIVPQWAYFPQPELQIINPNASGVPSSFSLKGIDFNGASSQVLALGASYITGLSDLNLKITENGTDKTYNLGTGLFNSPGIARNNPVSSDSLVSSVRVAVGMDPAYTLMLGIAYRISVKNGSLSTTPDYIYRGVMMVGCR